MHDRLCSLWWLLVFEATVVLGALPGGEIEFSDVPSSTQAALTALTVVVTITSVIALGCCACKLCQAKDPIVQAQHTGAIKETIQTAQNTLGDTLIAMEALAPTLINLGVTHESAAQAMDNPETLQLLELDEEYLKSVGGKAEIAEVIKKKQYVAASEHRKTFVKEEQLPETNRLDYKSEFDNYTIYSPEPKDKIKRKRRKKEGDSEYYETDILPPPDSPDKEPQPQLPGVPDDVKVGASGRLKRKVKIKTRVPKPEVGFITPQGTSQGNPEGHFSGLDAKHDFDDYTIYDTGELNEYGILKAQREKKTEGGAGLDVQADFDEYTIYDTGELNEYGILKAQREKKAEGGAGLDFKSDFDEYTIYDTGELNEYGILKAQREKKMEGGAGLDVQADFDEYTIYDLPGGNYTEINEEIAEAKKLREEKPLPKRPLPNLPAQPPGRPLPAPPTSAIGSRPLPMLPLPGFSAELSPGNNMNTTYLNFDEYTIYDTGELNEYGVLKAEKEKKVEGGAGLDTKADFDEYTIYDTGELNEYGVLKAEREKKKEGGAGLDTKADFDEYTIYDTGELNEYGVLKAEREKKKAEEVGTDKEGHDFDDYTIYQY